MRRRYARLLYAGPGRRKILRQRLNEVLGCLSRVIAVTGNLSIKGQLVDISLPLHLDHENPDKATTMGRVNDAVRPGAADRPRRRAQNNRGAGCNRLLSLTN